MSFKLIVTILQGYFQERNIADVTTNVANIALCELSLSTCTEDKSAFCLVLSHKKQGRQIFG